MHKKERMGKHTCKNGVFEEIELKNMKWGIEEDEMTVNKGLDLLMGKRERVVESWVTNYGFSHR